MYTLRRLETAGYRGDPVPHTYFQQEVENGHLAVILAGQGNNCQHPTLYYPTRELLLRGADALLVDYCLRPAFATLTGEELRACVTADTIASYQAATRERRYERVTLVGKSLGTLAMGHVLGTLSPSRQLQAVWLTPLLKTAELRAQIRHTHPRSLFVIGSEDPHYHAAEIAELAHVTRGAALVLPGADHLLEVPEGVLASLRVMGQILQALQDFLQGET